MMSSVERTVTAGIVLLLVGWKNLPLAAMLAAGWVIGGKRWGK